MWAELRTTMDNNLTFTNLCPTLGTAPRPLRLFREQSKITRGQDSAEADPSVLASKLRFLGIGGLHLTLRAGAWTGKITDDAGHWLEIPITSHGFHTAIPKTFRAQGRVFGVSPSRSCTCCARLLFASITGPAKCQSGEDILSLGQGKPTKGKEDFL